MSEAWYSQGVGNNVSFLSLVRQRLRDINMQDVTSRLRDTTRGSFYININPTLCFMTYLDTVWSGACRKALSRFRLSSHHLKVESGRWHKPQPIPFNDRKCILCNQLEDEFHFVCECPKYEEIRRIYIPHHIVSHCSMHKFIEFLCTNDSTMLQNLALFVVKATKIHVID